MNNYYIYEWFIVDTDEVFYVGKGKERRAETVSGRNKFFYGYPELQKETGLGLKKIKRILKESSEIFINNKTYIIIK